MKYSFIIPYYKRDCFFFSLKSFEKYYSSRNDYEIIVVEDIKNRNDPYHHKLLNDIISRFKLPIKLILNEEFTYNPSVSFNLGVKNSNGEYIILTNPECYHESDVLKGFDEEENKEEVYIVCANKSVVAISYTDKLNYHFREWFQHSVQCNRCLHHCACISEKNYLKINGFDEEYKKGIAFEDDDFVWNINKHKIPIIQRDDLITCHIAHNREHIDRQYHLYKLNGNYFNKKWNENKVF